MCGGSKKNYRIAWHTNNEVNFIFETTEDRPHLGQKAILDACDTLNQDGTPRYTTAVASCGRRFGKSWLLARMAAREMLNLEANVVIVSGVIGNRELLFNSVRKLVRSMGLPIVVDRSRDYTLQCIHGSKLKVVLEEEVDALAEPISLLLVDEPRFLSESTFRYCQGLTADYAPYSRTVILGTFGPDTPTWLVKLYEEGWVGSPIWSGSFPTVANPLLCREFIERSRTTLPADVFTYQYGGCVPSLCHK